MSLKGLLIRCVTVINLPFLGLLAGMCLLVGATLGCSQWLAHSNNRPVMIPEGIVDPFTPKAPGLIEEIHTLQDSTHSLLDTAEALDKETTAMMDEVSVKAETLSPFSESRTKVIPPEPERRDPVEVNVPSE